MNTNFQRAAKGALASYDELMNLYRHSTVGDLADATENDIAILKELIIKRILPTVAFDVLAAIDASEAGEMLFRRYLGADVDPDTKFGGFEFELASMLESLVDNAGGSSRRYQSADLCEPSSLRSAVFISSRTAFTISVQEATTPNSQLPRHYRHLSPWSSRFI